MLSSSPTRLAARLPPLPDRFGNLAIGVTLPAGAHAGHARPKLRCPQSHGLAPRLAPRDCARKAVPRVPVIRRCADLPTTGHVAPPAAGRSIADNPSSPVM